MISINDSQQQAPSQGYIGLLEVRYLVLYCTVEGERDLLKAQRWREAFGRGGA